MEFDEIIRRTSYIVDGCGVLVIVSGIVVSTVLFVFHSKCGNFMQCFRSYRQHLGWAILLGLEFLVAADIMRTVTISPSIGSVSALGLIVLIRTFLAMTLEMDLQGKWWWSREQK